MESTVILLGVIGVVILIAALSSGLLERSRLPQVLIFLLLGTAIGPYGLGLFDFPIQSNTLQVVATIGLVLVLFTDAVSGGLSDTRGHLRLASIVLGPGTALTAVLVALAARFLLDAGWAESAALGAALASTDPVLLRGILRSPATPAPARLALRIESGMNDALLLPAILVATAFMVPAPGGAESSWFGVVFRVLVLGGGAGLIVGVLAVGALDFLRRRTGIRRDYESLYVLAVALTAFAAAESVQASGFIAAFTAGLTIAALDIELCDCFYDYGEASAEMALLFSFVILGSSAIWTGLDVVSLPVLLFAAVALFARTAILALALAPARLDRRSRWMVVWFGPRGLSSLLIVLLPAFAGAPRGEYLFAVTSLVVLLSIAIHGGTQILLPPPDQLAPPRAPTPAQEALVAEPERITLQEIDHLRERGEPVAILDVRTESSYQRDRLQPAGAIRLPPERTAEAIPLLGLPPDTWLVLYCT
jgi:NhaP-type Na+/H+ or K+/H+ antiporter